MAQVTSINITTLNNSICTSRWVISVQRPSQLNQEDDIANLKSMFMNSSEKMGDQNPDYSIIFH